MGRSGLSLFGRKSLLVPSESVAYRSLAGLLGLGQAYRPQRACMALAGGCQECPATARLCKGPSTSQLFPFCSACRPLYWHTYVLYVTVSSLKLRRASQTLTRQNKEPRHQPKILHRNVPAKHSILIFCSRFYFSSSRFFSIIFLGSSNHFLLLPLPMTATHA